MAKTATLPDTFKLNPNGTVDISFDKTQIHLGQIRNGQLETLRADLQEINERIADIQKGDIAAAQEILAYNQEHIEEDGFQPKTFEGTRIVLVHQFDEWMRKVVAELGDGGELPADSNDWPVWLTSVESINALVEQWQFSPLDRGGE